MQAAIEFIKHFIWIEQGVKLNTNGIMLLVLLVLTMIAVALGIVASIKDYLHDMGKYM